MMKTFEAHFSVSPLLFRLAARLELPALRRALTPALRAAKKETTKLPTPRKLTEIKIETARTSLSGDDKHDSGPMSRETVSADSADEPRKILFQLKAPGACSVKLVADFTDWEKYALDMIQGDNGDWFAIVPLAPGNYFYRFLVDGEWFNDPKAPVIAPNPFGTANTVVQVV